MSSIKGLKADAVLIDEHKTIGTALVEIDGIAHFALCGRNLDDERWVVLACDDSLVPRLAAPERAGRLACLTCLWCVVEDGQARREGRPFHGPG